MTQLHNSTPIHDSTPLHNSIPRHSTPLHESIPQLHFTTPLQVLVTVLNIPILKSLNIFRFLFLSFLRTISYLSSWMSINLCLVVHLSIKYLNSWLQIHTSFSLHRSRVKAIMPFFSPELHLVYADTGHCLHFKHKRDRIDQCLTFRMNKWMTVWCL